MKIFFKLTLFLGVVVSILSLVPTQVFAASKSTPKPDQGVSVSPSLVQLDLDSTKPLTHLTYTNHTSQDVQLFLSAEDFTELEDGYKLSFLNQKDPENYKYRLSSWISFGQNTFVLKPGQSQDVLVLINASQLSPGAHYGTILARIEQGKGNETIQIQGILSSLLFVRTSSGTEKESASIQTFTQVENVLGFPGSFSLRFNNTGETTLTPYGLVEVKDVFGNLVAKGILNEDSLQTLPESVRRYDIPVKQISLVLFPSKYHATFTLHYGKKPDYLKSEITFYSIGSWPFLLVPVVIVGEIWASVKRRKTKAG